MTQKIYFRENVRERLSEIIRERGIEKLLLVCGGSFDALPLSGDILSLDAGIVRFGGFSPNPAYEDICAGLELFRRESCGAILAVASTDFFPWGPISALTRGKVGYIQFTWRLMMFVTPLLALAAGYGVAEFGGKRPDAAAVAALCLAGLCAMPTLSGELHESWYIEQGTIASPHLGLAYAEYTLPDTSFLATRDRTLHIEGGVTVSDYDKQGAAITAQVDAAQEGTVSFPLFNYDGYRATLNGQEIAIENGDNNRIQLRFPAGASGEVKIRFVGKAWWKITDAVSLLTLIGLGVVNQKEKKKRLNFKK